MKPTPITAAALRAATAAVVSAAALAAALAVALSAALPAQAQDLRKDDWSFNFFNDSSIDAVEFRVSETSGHYGHNWLSTPMAPGHGLTMEFSDPLDNRCEIMTRVVLGNRAAFEQMVNYCGTAIVRVTGNGLSYE